MRRSVKTIITSTLLATSLASFSSPDLVLAASFSQSEQALVKKLQNDYAALDQTPYTPSNLYQKAPSLVDPFNSGVLSPNYISAQMAGINYYRSLFDLGSITSNQSENNAAQTAASVMAAINANPFVNQHGLPNETNPGFISQSDWATARQVTDAANLNFNIASESAPQVIEDLIKDNYNLTGNDTGHRAWLLSTRLSQTGIGAAYGTSGYRYSVQTVMYGNDIFATASKAKVSYPSDGLFPIELLQGQNIPWSIYLSDQTVASTPNITITDVDTGQVVNATNVENHSSAGYGNFKTNITYYPSDLNMVSGHQYRVNIAGVEEYTFKLYNQVAANQPSISDTPSTTPTPDNPTTEEEKSALQLAAEKIRDSLNANRDVNSEVFGRSYQDGKKIHNLGEKQWFGGYFRYHNADLKAGVLVTDAAPINNKIYTSPYLLQQSETHAYLESNTAYPYGQVIQKDDYTWYYLGPNQWVRKLTIDAK